MNKYVIFIQLIHKYLAFDLKEKRHYQSAVDRYIGILKKSAQLDRKHLVIKTLWYLLIRDYLIYLYLESLKMIAILKMNSLGVKRKTMLPHGMTIKTIVQSNLVKEKNVICLK